MADNRVWQSGSRMRDGKLHVILVFWLVVCHSAWAHTDAAGHKFQADEWITECEEGSAPAPPACSITVLFWHAGGNPRGSFALVVMLQTGYIGIVGQPFPTRAVLQIDKNPPVECKQTRYCVFPGLQALNVVRQLTFGSLVLIDVYTQKNEFSFSLTPKGFQAGMAKIRAWGFKPD